MWATICPEAVPRAVERWEEINTDGEGLPVAGRALMPDCLEQMRAAPPIDLLSDWAYDSRV